MQENIWLPLPENGIDLGDPYKRLNQNFQLLEEYLLKVPSSISKDEVVAKNIGYIRDALRRYARKPNICFYGRFDSGKSTTANLLLGQNVLPASLSPWTRLPSIVKHINEKPIWMDANDVWIFNAEWNPTLWRDEQHCRKHRIDSGGYSILKNYVVHKKDDWDIIPEKVKKNVSKEKTITESYALIFLDAPILNSCSIIDFPGLDNSDDDTSKTINDYAVVDAMFFLSTITGFMGGLEMKFFGQMLDKTPPFEEINKDFPVLGNIFLLATHCNPKEVKDENVNNALNGAAKAIYDYFGETKIKNRSNASGIVIGPREIRNRIFVAWISEVSGKYGNFIASTEKLLSTELPKFWQNKIDAEIQRIKDTSVEEIKNLITEYTLHLKSFDLLEKSYRELMSKESSRIQFMTTRNTQILSKIIGYKGDCTYQFTSFYDEFVTESNIIKIINQKYSSKKDAKEYTAGYVIEQIQGKLIEIIEPKSKIICNEVQEFVQEYKKAKNIASDKINLSLGFDEVASFTNGVLKVSSLGALASLGVYFGGAWLATHATGVLATIGAAMAGASGTILTLIGSFMATITGPIVVGILAIIALFSFFGDWKKELAKKIIKSLSEQNVKSKLVTSITTYWDDTEKSFKVGSETIETDWRRLLTKKGEEIEKRSLSDLQIQEILAQTEKAKIFFSEVPWIASTNNKI